MVVVEIFTTEGITLSAKSANEEGMSLALTDEDIDRTINAFSYSASKLRD